MRRSFIKLLRRNAYTREGAKASKGKVNLEFYRDDTNLGDYLSKVVSEYMLSLRKMTFEQGHSKKKYMHLLAVGSLLGGRGDFDATVWGSGIRNFSSVKGLCLKRYYQKLDIRAVRGPVTRDALMQCKIQCPKVYGDPVVLMPLIYQPEGKKRQGTILIRHYLSSNSGNDLLPDITRLDIKTKDYKSFIDTIACAERVISSSLHGIILAESYGTPAVFLQQGIETEMLKFYDWYYSTGRKNVMTASTLEEAMRLEPMNLPDLENMRKDLIHSFPYDLWE